MIDDALARRHGLWASRTERYRRMVEIRSFEDRVQDLFAEGIVHGTTHTAQGQEAVAVGVAAAIRPSDRVTCTYRGHGLALALGMSPESALGEIMGRTVGSVGGIGGSMHLCDMSVGLLPTFAIVGAGIPVAVGAALTAQVNGTGDVAVAVFGDGAANIGAFHESLNLASIWKLPVVFVCENNQYGEYSRIDLTTPIEDIAERAAGYAMVGTKVDGQDPDGVEAVTKVAVDRARAGEGPTLIEAKTYRYAGHSRADPATYRPEGEFDRWFERDPIKVFGERLVAEGELGPEELAVVASEVEAELERVIEFVRSSPAPDVRAMFAHVYAD